MLYLKSLLVGIGIALVITPGLSYFWLWFTIIRHKAPGLTAVAGGPPIITTIAAMALCLFLCGTALGYLFFR